MTQSLLGHAMQSTEAQIQTSTVVILILATDTKIY